jgi:hypothetical protein
MGLMMVTHHDEKEKTSLLKNIQKTILSLINWIAKGQQKKGINCKA